MTVSITGVSSTGFVAGGYVGGPVTALHYAANGAFDASFNYAPFNDGFNLASVNDVGALDILPSGCYGLVYLGYSAGGADATFISMVTPFIGNPKLFGFYLADQPDISNTWGTYYDPANLKQQSDYIHANLPGAITFIVLPNQGSAESPGYVVNGAAYTPANTDIDYFGINPYPVRNDVTGGFDPTIITAAVAAVVTSGVPSNQIIPLYQAFGGGGFFPPWSLPTVAQTLTSLATWAAILPTVPFDYTYSWGSVVGDVALTSSPALQQVFMLQNSLSPFLSLTDSFTGAAATGSAGTVSLASNVLTVSPTGVAGSGQAASENANVSATPNGVSAAGQIGTVTATSALIATATGVSGTGQAGSLLFRTPQGIAGTTQAGTLIDTVTLTVGGVSATGQIGTVSLSNAVVAVLTGVSTTSQIATLIATDGVLVTGVSAAGQAGTLSATNATLVTVTGVSTTSQVGTATDTLVVTVTGVQAAGQVGATSQIETVVISGVSTASQVGTVVHSFTVSVTGIAASGFADTESDNIQVVVGGVAATAQAGTPTTTQFTGIAIPGRAGTGAAGIPTIQNAVTVTGVASSGQANVTTGATPSSIAGAPATGQGESLFISLLSALVPIASTASLGLVTVFAPGQVFGVAGSTAIHSVLDEIDHPLIGVSSFGLVEAPFAPPSSPEVYVMVME